MKKAIIVLIWIASVILTYWLGIEQAGESVGPETVNQPFVSDSSAISKKDDEQRQIKSVSALPKESISEKVVVAQPRLEEKTLTNPKRSDFQDRIKSSNPVVRLLAFAQLLEDGTPQSIEQARGIYEKLPEGPQRFSELRMLAYSWGQSDPQSALEWAQKLDGFDQRLGTGSVLDSWARYDSAGAIAWAKENFEGEENPYYIGIISGMSENDLLGASELMTALPYGRVRGRAASILVEKTWQMGEDVAIHFADNLPEGSIQNFAFGEIAKKIAKDDLGRAVQWVEKMEESEVKVQVSEDVAERWARESPVEAAEWVSQMPEGEARSESMEEVVTQWARKDPTATAEWLNQFPSGELMDEPIQRFVREIARKDPDSAMTWAQSIVDEERRKRAEADVERIIAAQSRDAQSDSARPPSTEPGRRPRGGPPGSAPR
ncbi:MAG: hypothetical protein VX153_01100 [Verrucomicrobiota bacterium]|nr:hypothetical protein [Verrucomicrobiota bacterium]